MNLAATPAQRNLFDLAGRLVLVLGLGDSGIAMARWAARRGARLRVVDTRSLDEGSDLAQWQALRSAIPDAEYARGAPWSESWLDGVDLVAWSPGLSIERGESGAFHALALARGIAVAGELELFAQALAELREGGYATRCLAVTGTNGKTTTTALAAHLCRSAGWSTVSAGNIRPALLDALREAIESDALPQVWVLELSSFQLALSHGFGADAAALLNVSEDHLDWHDSMDRYVQAKQRIYTHADVAVFDRGDPATAPRDQRASMRLISFGADAPRLAGEFGLVRDAGMVWLAQAQAEDDTAGASPGAGAGRRRRVTSAA